MLTWFLLGIMGLLFSLFLEQRGRARKKSRDLAGRILENENRWTSIVADIVCDNRKSFPDGMIDPESKAYLIVVENQTIQVRPLNNDKTEKISWHQYQKIKKKVNKHTTYQYTYQTISIFYCFGKPFDGCVLWLKYHSDVFK